MSNVFEKLQDARVILQGSKLKKSGKNNYSGFTYFELADFIPTVNKLFKDLKLCSNFSIMDGLASLTIINSEEPNDRTVFTMPTAELELKGCTPVQALGGVNTYCRRYLYLNALEIVENDILDSKAGAFEEPKPKKQETKTNNDIDIISEMKNIETIDKLNKYYYQYEKEVSDLKKFQAEYTIRAKELSKGGK